MKVGDVYRVLNAEAMSVTSTYKNGDFVKITRISSDGNGRDEKGYFFPPVWVGKHLEPIGLELGNEECGVAFSKDWGTVWAWGKESKPNMERFKQDVKNTLSRWRTPNQVSGTHYSDLVVEPNDYAVLNNLDPIQHNVIKYVTRARSEEDLDKAISQIQRLKEYKFGRKE